MEQKIQHRDACVRENDVCRRVSGATQQILSATAIIAPMIQYEIVDASLSTLIDYSETYGGELHLKVPSISSCALPGITRTPRL